MALTVQRIHTAEALRSLDADWRKLEGCHPFQSPEWSCAWWEHMRDASLRIRDELYACAVRDGSGRLVAVAPLMRTLRPGVGPAVRIVQFLGADVNLTELRAIAARREDEPGAIRAVLDDLRARSSDWDWLLWGAVRADGPAAEVLAREPGLEWLPHQNEYVLPLAATWDEQRAKLSRNIKESLRKCYNAPKRDGVNLQFSVARTPAEIRAALPRLFDLHARRADLDGTVKHQDVFASPRARAFIGSAAPALASRNAAFVFQLSHDGTVVASRLGFLTGEDERLYLYYSGFDPAYAKYSVMTTTVCEVIRWSIGERLRTLDFSFGTDVSKTRWGPEAIGWRSATIPSPSWRGRTTRALYSNAMKFVPTDLVRAWLGRQTASRGQRPNRP
jgi:CelD/BcsL family acetyltransferase involved in cellulose biosynthesis